MLVILHVTVNGSSSWILPGASTTVNFSSGSGGTWTNTVNYTLETIMNIRTAAFSCPVWILPLSPNFDLQTRSIFPTETWFCCTACMSDTGNIAQVYVVQWWFIARSLMWNPLPYLELELLSWVIFYRSTADYYEEICNSPSQTLAESLSCT